MTQAGSRYRVSVRGLLLGVCAVALTFAVNIAWVLNDRDRELEIEGAKTRIIQFTTLTLRSVDRFVKQEESAEILQYTLRRAATAQFGARYEIVDRRGRVVADSGMMRATGAFDPALLRRILEDKRPKLFYDARTKFLRYAIVFSGNTVDDYYVILNTTDLSSTLANLNLKFRNRMASEVGIFIAFFTALAAILWLLLLRPASELQQFGWQVARGDLGPGPRRFLGREMDECREAFVSALRTIFDQRREIESKNAELSVLLQFQKVKLAETEAVHLSILSTAHEAIITIDSDMRVIAFNPAAEIMFGYSADEIVGDAIEKLIPERFWADQDRFLRGFATSPDATLRIKNWRNMIGLNRSGHEFGTATSISKATIAENIWLTIIFRDMTDMILAESKLQAMAVEREESLAIAVESNRAKSSFLATMSHEFRTPLNAIIGFSSMIDNEIFGSIQVDKYKEYVKDIHASGEHLLSLVNDILDLSRIEAGKFEYDIEPLSGVAAINEVVAFLTPLAAGNTVTLVPPGNSAFDSILGDRRAVHQILTNLIGNAIKFTDAGGKVQMHVRPLPEDGLVALVVEDNGRGIPSDKIAGLGSPFFQVASPMHRDRGGSGLGLAICKSLITGLGGRLEIESEVGKGTIVRVLLPKGPGLRQ